MAKKQKKTSAGYNTLRNRLGHFIVGGVLIFAGPILSLYFWLGVKDGRASENWPTAKGKITEAKLFETQDRTGLHFETKVRYTFVVDGKKFEGDRLKVGGKATSNLEEAEADMKRYGKLDKTVEVRYDPGDPNRSTLETGISSSNFIPILGVGPGLLVLGLFLVGIGGLMTLLAWRKPPAEDESDDDEKDRPKKAAKKGKPDDDEDDGEEPPRKRKPR